MLEGGLSGLEGALGHTVQVLLLPCVDSGPAARVPAVGDAA